MLERQSRRHLHPKINVNQLLHTISDVDKHKCIIHDMVRDSCITANKWHQSTALVWYDCPICAKMMALTTLLRHSIYHDGNHQHKKGINAQSTLWRWRHKFYKSPSKGMKKVYAYIAIQKSWIHFY